MVARDSPRGELTELAKVKLVERANPDPTLGWDKKKEIKESCWILEERDGDFFCDCKFGFKGHLCDHTLGMHYRQETGMLEASDQVHCIVIVIVTILIPRFALFPCTRRGTEAAQWGLAGRKSTA